MSQPRPLTARQAAILAFMQEFQASEDRMPSSREISARFGYHSQTASCFHLRALVKKGYLQDRRYPDKTQSWFRFPRRDNTLPTLTP